jgi:predicted GNAT family N-acyltransferase
MRVIVKVANSSGNLKSVFAVRKKVFVEEQAVSEEEEYDAFETSSTHLIASIDKNIVGTCRFRNTNKGIKLERFAVLKEYRNNGVGVALVKETLNQVDISQHVYLHAQVQVVDFYAKYGFVKTGDLFEEAGIKHFKMVLEVAL